MDAELTRGEPEEGPVSVLTADISNLRTAVEFGLRTGDVETVRQITASLPMYWIVRGLSAEGRSWLERALALSDAEDDTRRKLLSALGTIAYGQGDHLAAVAASDEAASLAAQLGGATTQLELLKEQANAALTRNDFEAAEPLFRERLAAAIAVDNGVGTSSCRLNLAYLANRTRATTLRTASSPRTCPSFARRVRRAVRRTRSRASRRRCSTETVCRTAPRTRCSARPAHCRSRTAPSRSLVSTLRRLRRGARGRPSRCDHPRRHRGSPRGHGVGPDEDEEAIRSRALQSIGDDDSVLAPAWREGRALDLAAAVEVASAG